MPSLKHYFLVRGSSHGVTGQHDILAGPGLGVYPSGEQGMAFRPGPAGPLLVAGKRYYAKWIMVAWENGRICEVVVAAPPSSEAVERFIEAVKGVGEIKVLNYHQASDRDVLFALISPLPGVSLDEVASTIRKKIPGADVILVPPVEGVLVDKVGFPIVTGQRRLVILDESMVKGLIQLALRLGAGGAALLYHVGVSVGKGLVEGYRGHVTNPRNLVDVCLGILQASGWGIFDVIDFGENHVVIDVHQCLECSLLTRMGHPGRSSLVKGIITGIVEAATGKPCRCEEVECIVRGGDKCRFVCTIFEEGES